MKRYNLPTMEDKAALARSKFELKDLYLLNQRPRLRLLHSITRAQRDRLWAKVMEIQVGLEQLPAIVAQLSRTKLG
jgi:hypothetical protein